MKHRILVSDEVYEYLKLTIDDEHVANTDMSGEIDSSGNIRGYRPTFSEVIEHLIEDREESWRRKQSD